MKTSLHAIALAALLAATAAAQAQQPLYRSVEPNGQVTYSDRLPGGAAVRQANVGEKVSPAGGGAQLPYELAQARQKFPVTLYSGNDCHVCVSARGLLVRRGVPYIERTVSTEADLKAMREMFGDTSIPVLTVGRQHIRGIEEGEWNRNLDAAGYPKTSMLPSTWRNAAPTPLTTPAPEPETENETENI